MRIKISLLVLISSLLPCAGGLWALPSSISPNGLNTSVSSSSNFYRITGGLQEGGTVFESFSSFNLGTHVTADFVAGSGVDNILARVTGGASTIDGTITSTEGNGGTVSSANLFLINPAGLAFTANAQINLNGSFVVSTANYVKLGTGSSPAYFYADLNHPINDAGLTSSPVSAFGFVGTTAPQPVTFTGAQLTTASGAGLHVIAGNITLNGTTASNGANLSAPGGYLTMFSAGSSGEVPFSLSSPGSGYFGASFAKLGAINFSDEAGAAISGAGGGAVVIRGGQLVMAGGSTITSYTFGPIRGGSISVKAADLTINSGSFINTDSYGGSAAGSVTVDISDSLDITGAGSEIAADTETSGNAGVVAINAQGASVDLNGGSIFAATNSAGAAGTVNITAATLTMEGQADISTSSPDGIGNAGDVNVNLTGLLSMHDTASILADTFTSGEGGNVSLTAAQIEMIGDPNISASTLGFGGGGNGGSVTVATGPLSIIGTGKEPIDTLGIFALSSFLGGNAGNVKVTATTLTLSGGAYISSASQERGLGGTVTVHCTDGQLTDSTITASSVLTNAGVINITANTFSLFNGSSVTTSSGANGGNVTFEVSKVLYLDDSNIQAFAGVPSYLPAPPDDIGGNITIDPEFLILNNSFISANDLATTGENGNILNVANLFFSSQSFLHATGTIQSPSPDLQLGGQLISLPANLTDARSQLKETCAQSVSHEFSSLVVVGRGGTEAAPDELQPDFGTGPEVLR